MRILSLVCPSEFSGESLVGVLADLGVSPSTFEWELNGIEIGDHHLHFDREEVEGVRSVRFGVHGGILHVDHQHSPDHHHDHAHTEDHPITYPKLREHIDTAKLSAFVKSHSLGILRRIAGAQSNLTATQLDRVEFSEAEALEWLVPSVLSCVGLDQLQVGQIFIQQTLKSSGGQPAHRALSRAILSELSTPEHLETSPAGAAILAEFAAKFEAPPKLKSIRTGHGLGPGNELLRATLGEFA